MTTRTHTVEVHGPLNLARTLRGFSVWGASTWLRVDATGGWYAARTEEGPATVHLTLDGSRLNAEAWGPGADRLLDQVPRLAGLHDDPSVLEPHHDIVAEIQRRRPGVRIASVDQVFPTMVAVVIAQKVTGKESAAAVRRMAWKWGEVPPGPREDLRLLPSPQMVKEQPYSAFHPLGVERKRAMIVIEVARRARRMEQCVGMPFEQALARMQLLHGIGPWTAGAVLSQALGEPDAVPVGDYHLPNVVSWNLAGEPRADDDRMLELLEPYRGQRGRVVRMLKGGGTAPPKWGPRSEARDIRGL
ncbi:MAG: hypothetical protein KTR31_22575 [Myxococcales bacterium]|nr:hypothetical protein [Myxococcales bacterium]